MAIPTEVTNPLDVEKLMGVSDGLAQQQQANQPDATVPGSPEEAGKTIIDPQQQEENIQLTVNEPEVTQVTENQGLTVEEQRRLTQSKLDKERNRAAQLEAELNQTREMVNMMRSMMMNINQNNVQSSASQTVSQDNSNDVPPDFNNYINGIQYDTMDAADPRTESGRAYAKYQNDLLAYNSAQTKKAVLNEINQQQRLTELQKNVNALIKKYPKYINSWTNQPDYDKIKQELSGYGDDFVSVADYLNWKEENNGKSKAITPNNQVLTSNDLMNQMANAASYPKSVASTTPANPAKQVKINPDLVVFNRLFGDGLTID